MCFNYYIVITSDKIYNEQFILLQLSGLRVNKLKEIYYKFIYFANYYKYMYSVTNEQLRYKIELVILVFTFS